MKYLGILTAAIVSVSGANAFAARIANGNAAELAAHRVEKLVLLKKVAPEFQKQFLGLEIKQINPGGVNQPSFEVIASQEVDQGETANKVTVILDENGKALAHKVAAGKTATAPTKWTDKDPLTLTELALHHIEHMMSDKKLEPFYKGLKALRVSQAQHGTHIMVAVEILSDLSEDTLLMSLDTKGELLSYEIKAKE